MHLLFNQIIIIIPLKKQNNNSINSPYNYNIKNVIV
jgi:hypothetical protein